MKNTLAVATLVVSAMQPARAEFVSGNLLLEYLSSKDAAVVGVGVGYVMGVFDTGHGVRHCAPERVTVNQVRDMVHAFLVGAPNVRHASGDVIVATYLSTVWPCQRGEPPRGTL